MAAKSCATPKVTLSMDSVKGVLRKFMPFLRMMVAVTPNKVDDEAVKVLDAWLAEPAGTTLAQVMQDQGHVVT